MPKQIAPLNVPQPGQGWDPSRIRQALESAGFSPVSLAQSQGLTPEAVRYAILGTRRGLLARTIVANAIGVRVDEIWPDALLRPKFRRAS